MENNLAQLKKELLEKTLAHTEEKAKRATIRKEKAELGPRISQLRDKYHFTKREPKPVAPAASIVASAPKKKDAPVVFEGIKPLQVEGSKNPDLEIRPIDLEKVALESVIPTKVTIEEEKAPAQKDYEAFKQNFMREHAGDGLETIFDKLEQLPEFNDPNLTEGRKMLVVQGLVDSIHEELEKSVQQEFQHRGALPHNVLGKIPVISKLAFGIKNAVDRGINKNKIEKQSLNDILGSQDFVNERGANLIKLYNENGLDAIYSHNTTVLTDYAKVLEYGDSPEAKILNIVGTNFARIPQSWGIRSQATNEQYKTWQEAKLGLDKAIEKMGPIFKERAEKSGTPDPNGLSPEARGGIEARMTKSMIELMAQLAKNPDAAEELRSVATDSNMKKVVDSAKKFFMSNKGFAWMTQLAAGAGMRAGGVTLLAGTAIGGTAFLGIPIATLLAASAAGAGIGFAFRGGKVAKEKLLAEAKSARNATLFQTIHAANGTKHFEKKSATSAVMSKIEHRTTQLKIITQELMDLGASNGSPIDIANKQNQLETHLKYIQEKIEKGEMNYGDEQGEYARTVGLMLAKQEADVALAMTKQHADSETAGWSNIYKYFINTKDSTGLPIHGADRKSKYDSSDARRQRLLHAMQGSKQAGSIRFEIDDARRSAALAQRFKSAAQGALIGSIGAYVGKVFGDLRHGVSFEAHKFAGNIVDGVKNHIPSTGGFPTTTAPGWGSMESIGQAPNLHDAIQHTPTTATPNTTPTAHEIVQPKIAHTIDAKNPLVHVSIKHEEGVGDALLKLRHSPSFQELVKTNPKMAKFFQGNIWDEAKSLHAFRPGNAAGDSVIVGEGSEIGITKDGDIYLSNTLSGGRAEVIGHVDPATGKFSEVAPAHDMHYGHKPETAAPRSATKIAEHANHPAHSGHKEYPLAGDEAPEVTPTKTGLPKHEYPLNPDEAPEAPNADHPKMDASQYPESGDEAPEIKAPAANQIPIEQRIANFTRRDWIRVDNVAEGNIIDDLNQGFGRRNFLGLITHRGTASTLWKGMAERPTASVLEQPIGDFTQPVQSFMQHIRVLAASHPEVAPSEKFGAYVEELYKADAQEFVATHPNTDPQ